MRICTNVLTMTTTATVPSIVTRGSTIIFQATFRDADGAVMTPTSPTLLVTYLLDGAEVEADPVTMTQSAGDDHWEALWQSEVSAPGDIAWTIEATDGDERLTRKDGMIKLTANRSNPGPS
jgi:hypothetical protein